MRSVCGFVYHSIHESVSSLVYSPGGRGACRFYAVLRLIYGALACVAIVWHVTSARGELLLLAFRRHHPVRWPLHQIAVAEFPYLCIWGLRKPITGRYKTLERHWNDSINPKCYRPHRADRADRWMCEGSRSELEAAWLVYSLISFVNSKKRNKPSSALRPIRIFAFPFTHFIFDFFIFPYLHCGDLAVIIDTVLLHYTCEFLLLDKVGDQAIGQTHIYNDSIFVSCHLGPETHTSSFFQSRCLRIHVFLILF